MQRNHSQFKQFDSSHVSHSSHLFQSELNYMQSSSSPIQVNKIQIQSNSSQCKSFQYTSIEFILVRVGSIQSNPIQFKPSNPIQCFSTRINSVQCTPCPIQFNTSQFQSNSKICVGFISSHLISTQFNAV